ncbi:importin subunit alpha-9-like protein [Tanacetum coccineum]
MRSSSTPVSWLAVTPRVVIAAMLGVQGGVVRAFVLSILIFFCHAKVKELKLQAIADSSALTYSSSPHITLRLSLPPHRRSKSTMAIGSVENAAKQKRRQHAVSVVKERREATFRTKRLCRDGVSVDMDVASYGGMLIEEEPSVLDAHMGSTVEELKLAVSFESEFLFVKIALKRGVMPLLGQCLKFGSEDKQLLEAARCLTNIAGGKSEETRAFLPTL